jgi:hypothetical protein
MNVTRSWHETVNLFSSANHGTRLRSSSKKFSTTRASVKFETSNFNPGQEFLPLAGLAVAHCVIQIVDLPPLGWSHRRNTASPYSTVLRCWCSRG